jgi:hypothetical protein
LYVVCARTCSENIVESASRVAESVWGVSASWTVATWSVDAGFATDFSGGGSFEQAKSVRKERKQAKAAIRRMAVCFGCTGPCAGRLLPCASSDLW